MHFRSSALHLRMRLSSNIFSTFGEMGLIVPIVAYVPPSVGVPGYLLKIGDQAIAGGAWTRSSPESGCSNQDDDGRDYLFYQGNNDKGRTWYLSVTPIDWRDGKPVLAPNKLRSR